MKWYQNLLDDLKTEIVERIFRSRMEIIELKHFIGTRILQDELHYKRGEYGKQIVEKLAEDLKVSRTDLYLCIEFAKKYPIVQDLDNLPEGKNLSWNKIIQNYLPEVKVEPKKEDTKLCEDCGDTEGTKQILYLCSKCLEKIKGA